MIVGTGVDIIQIDRVAHMLEAHGERFTAKIYTEAEVARCARRRNQAQEYAARWASKEATMKALGTGWRQGVRFKDIENYNLPSGKPMIRLHGRGRRHCGPGTSASGASRRRCWQSGCWHQRLIWR